MKSLLFILLAVLSVAAQAVTLEDLQQRFSQVPVLRAEFAQQRTISGMAQPLNSSGNLVIAQQQGAVAAAGETVQPDVIIDRKSHGADYGVAGSAGRHRAKQPTDVSV